MSSPGKPEIIIAVSDPDGEEQQNDLGQTSVRTPLPTQPGVDWVQRSLDAVNSRLTNIEFLRGLTPSRLPSQAASEGSRSASPANIDANISASINANLRNPESVGDILAGDDGQEEDEDDLTTWTAPLVQEPCCDLGLDNIDFVLVPGIDENIYNDLTTAFLGAHRAFEAMMAADRGFQTFAHGHQDLVLAVDFNYFGNRMLSASSDHRLKVWDKKDDTWTLVESWRAHDAEIVDAKWNGPFMGEVIASIGEDGRCKIWQEDVTELPMSGRRFKLIANIGSPTNAPFMSLDFKNQMNDTYLALVTRDGRLIVYEPSDQSNLNEWKILGEHWVYGNSPPERHEEVGFKVAFHKEKLPCWKAIMAGLDRRALSLAVVSMRNVSIWRTDKARRFYPAAELKGAKDIIRDVAWANGSMRGYDIIATASKDGAIRIYEVSNSLPDKSTGTASTSAATATEQPASPRPGGPRKNAPSGIGAGLAGTSRSTEHGREQEQIPGRVYQSAKLIDTLTHHHGAVWQVTFSQMGDLLVSTGDDATVRTWKKAASGHWAEYAEIDTVRN